MSPGGSKPFDLGPKLVSVERALAAIRAGSRIYIGTGCAAPRTLLTRLEAMEPAPVDLEFVSFLTTSALPQMEGASHTHHRHGLFRWQRNARSGRHRPTRLRAHLAGGGAAPSSERTVADRRSVASGFPA